MIKWFKRKHDTGASEDTSDVSSLETLSFESHGKMDEVVEPVKEGMLVRLRKSLSKTRHQLGDGIGRLLLGKKEISTELLEELETLLVSADLGLMTTQTLLQQLADGLARNRLSDGKTVYESLQAHLRGILDQNSQSLTLETADHSPFVLLMVGVNGAGKTTTIGKLAKQFQREGKKVMLAAGDTFRAAAVEQLHIWGERNNIPVISQQKGADSASVIFDSLQAAKARKIDILIADTAGRLHTQHNLMDELKKVKRVLQKLCPEAPHETMLVLDATIGQNALVQAKQFHESIGLTGITMTKLDGTAKGGILFAIAQELKIPFRYIGIGEGIDDLRPFNAEQFVSALFQ